MTNSVSENNTHETQIAWYTLNAKCRLVIITSKKNSAVRIRKRDN